MSRFKIAYEAPKSTGVGRLLALSDSRAKTVRCAVFGKPRVGLPDGLRHRPYPCISVPRGTIPVTPPVSDTLTACPCTAVYTVSTLSGPQCAHSPFAAHPARQSREWSPSRPDFRPIVGVSSLPRISSHPGVRREGVLWSRLLRSKSPYRPADRFRPSYAAESSCVNQRRYVEGGLARPVPKCERGVKKPENG